MNLPNLISLARLFAVPLIVWLILREKWQIAFWLFVAAGISDAVDGFIAKRFGTSTVLGSFLDPLADKALIVAIYVTLGYKEHLVLWLVIMVVFRDLVIIGGALLFHAITQTLEMAPLMISKVNTVAQIVLAAVVLGTDGFAIDVGVFRDLLIYLVAITTFASGAAYVVTWSRMASAIEEGKSP